MAPRAKLSQRNEVIIIGKSFCDLACFVTLRIWRAVGGGGGRAATAAGGELRAARWRHGRAQETTTTNTHTCEYGTDGFFEA